jgi:tetratricopeptide (TPR) repeat protein
VSFSATRPQDASAPSYTRELLAEAHRARNKGRERRAVALYRRVLLEDPDDAEVALRLAPLLARRGEGFEAWQLYRNAARELSRRKRWEECLNVYREACRFVPYEFEAWRLCAELLIKMRREDVAFEILLEGRTHFRSPSDRAQAIALLSRARTIEPWDVHLVMDLARLYVRADLEDVALELLACLAQRCQGAELRGVRALQWRLTLSFRFAWLWLRSFYGTPEEEVSFERV